MVSKKVKKMTGKEFKRVFSECYGDFDIWGYEGILNIICIALTHQIQVLKGYGVDMSSIIKREEERREKIWEYLKKNGYFD